MNQVEIDVGGTGMAGDALRQPAFAGTRISDNERSSQVHSVQVHESLSAGFQSVRAHESLRSGEIRIFPLPEQRPDSQPSMRLPCLRSRQSQTPVAAVREPPEPHSHFPERRVTRTVHNQPNRHPELYIRRFRSSRPRAEIQRHRRTVPAPQNVAVLSRQPEPSRIALAFVGAMTHNVQPESSFAIRRTDRHQTVRAHGVEYGMSSS